MCKHGNRAGRTPTKAKYCPTLGIPGAGRGALSHPARSRGSSSAEKARVSTQNPSEHYHRNHGTVNSQRPNFAVPFPDLWQAFRWQKKVNSQPQELSHRVLHLRCPALPPRQSRDDAQPREDLRAGGTSADADVKRNGNRKGRLKGRRQRTQTDPRHLASEQGGPNLASHQKSAALQIMPASCTRSFSCSRCLAQPRSLTPGTPGQAAFPARRFNPFISQRLQTELRFQDGRYSRAFRGDTQTCSTLHGGAYPNAKPSPPG